MKKLSLLCAALLVAGCSNQTSQVVKEEYVGATVIKFPAPKGMEEITPKMGTLYDLSMQVRNADPELHYFAEYANMANLASTTNSCAALMDRDLVYHSIPHNYFSLLKSGAKASLKEASVSAEVKDDTVASNNKVQQYLGRTDEYQGARLLQQNLLFEDENTLVHSVLYEDIFKSEGKIKTKENISVIATSYVKDKIISLKCQSTKPEYKSELSSLVLDWNKAFFIANK